MTQPPTTNHQTLAADLEQQRRQLDALREIGQAINSAWGLDNTLELIVRRTAQVMGVDSCSIYLLNAGRLLLRASTGLDPAALGRGSLAVGEGLTGWAVEYNQTVAEPDAANDPPNHAPTLASTPTHRAGRPWRSSNLRPQESKAARQNPRQASSRARRSRCTSRTQPWRRPGPRRGP